MIEQGDGTLQRRIDNGLCPYCACKWKSVDNITCLHCKRRWVDETQQINDLISKAGSLE